MAVTPYVARAAYLGDGGTTSNDALFRSWGSMINAALSGIGLVQASDTGQINWTTVTWPGTVSTAAGYEIWRFNDSLQSTAPVFVKVEYGRWTGFTFSVYALWITIGTGTNGAGTITGTSTTRTVYTFGSPVQTIFGMQDTDDCSYSMAIQYHGSTGNHTLVFERTRNVDTLAPDSRGVFFYGLMNTNNSSMISGSYQFHAIDFVNALSTTTGSWLGNFVEATGAWTASGTTVAQEQYWGMNGSLSPLVGMAAYPVNGLATGGRYTITRRDSKTRTYLCTGMRINSSTLGYELVRIG